MILKPLEIEGIFDKDTLVYINDKELQYNSGVSKNIIKDIQDKTMQIYSGYYIFGRGYDSPKIFLSGRGINSGKFKIKIQNFKPYCYISQKGGSYKDYLGNEVEKLVFKGMHPSRVKTFREVRRKKGFPLPYEADVIFCRRIMIDMYDYFKPNESIEPKVAILDIETNHPINNDVISYAINSTDELMFDSKYTTKYGSELSLDIYEKLQKYDVVTGWNIGFDIDILFSKNRKEPVGELDRIEHHLNYARNGKRYTKDEYIENMSGKYFSDKETENLVNVLLDRDYLREVNEYIELGNKKFDSNISHMVSIIDLLPISKKMHAREIKGRWNLGNVGKQIVGLDKIYIGAKHIKDLPEDELLEYNVIDTIIPELIDNFLGGIETHLILSWSLHCLLEETLITAVVNDIALLRAYHREGIVLPSRDYSEKSDKSTYKAAEPDAKTGIYKGLITLDIKHAYPSAVISKNISPETKDSNGEYYTPNGIRFNGNKSVFIETLKELIEDRRKITERLSRTKKGTSRYKKLKSISFALKTQSAAFSHGIFGWVNGRMKDIEVADSITSVVRNILNILKKACEVINLEWSYTHTDAIYVRGNKNDVSGITGYLNDIISDYCSNDLLVPELEFKDYYPYSYIHSPARNILVPEDGNLDDVDTWDVTGMSFMRSETSPALADIEIELIKLKMKGASVSTLKWRLKERIKKLRGMDSTKLGLIKPLKKPIEDYGRLLKDGTRGGYPGHIKALTRAHSEYGFMVEVGGKFMMLPVMTDETVGVRKIRRKRVDIAFDIDEGLGNGYKIDFQYYLRSNLFGKIYQLFDLKPRELENEIMTDNMINILNKGGNICQNNLQKN